MGDIDKRIEEAREDIAWVKGGWSDSDAEMRITARAEKRLSDLIAVRDGLAVEVYATVSVTSGGMWASHGDSRLDAQSDRIKRMAVHSDADRLTILRGIARKPVLSVDEVDAESEEA